MLPDDRYRAGLERTAASILAWSGFVRDVADVSYADDADSWSFGLQPHIATACPVALVIGRTSQFHSLTLGRESYSDLPVDTFDLFLALLEAVVAGRVIERHHLARAKGFPVAVEMRVGPGPTPLFTRRRLLASLPRHTEPSEWTEIRDRHFLPYRPGPK